METVPDVGPFVQVSSFGALRSVSRPGVDEMTIHGCDSISRGRRLVEYTASIRPWISPKRDTEH